ncbi:MAG: hypothetical protein GX957_08555 [Clostridiaceae bacterium]|nr:hypothetical protein [Clostridiaceae bacterium]
MKKKTEFSKKIFTGISIATAIVVIFSLIMIWRTSDLTPLAYIIPAVFAELATATGFYYYKAKRENEIKLKSIYGKEVVQDEDYTQQI